MVIAYTRCSSVYDDSRTTKEIGALLEDGHRIVLFGWDRDGKALQNCTELFSDYRDKIEFHFFYGKTGKGIIGKIVARLRWFDWLKRQLLCTKGVDFIHSCDFDTGSAVKAVARQQHIRYVYDIFDYYVDSHPVPRCLRTIIEREETAVINLADATIICTEERREQIANAKPKRLVIIHNSPDVEKAESKELKYDYVYCGSMYGGRLISEILEEYKKHRELRFVFAGYGEYAGKAKQLDGEEENFIYLGTIPYHEVLTTESQARIISAIYDSSKRNHRLCAPNKFYEALALGKPVIVCRGTGIDQIVEDHRIGVVIDYNVNQFYQAVSDLARNRDTCDEMGKRARKLYEDQYRWSIMKDRLLDLYKDLQSQQNEP